MVRSMLVLLMLAAAGFAADPPKAERPDPKKWAEKWEKDGVTVEVEEARYNRESVAVYLRLKNGTKKEITLKKQVIDDVFVKTGKPDPDGPLAGVLMADGIGEAFAAVVRSPALKGGEDRPLKAGEEAVVTIIFPRPPASGRYFLTVPGEAIGISGTVRMSLSAEKLLPEEPKKK